MNRKRSNLRIALLGAGLLFVVQASLAAHSLGHAAQQNDAFCSICAFEGYDKVLPSVPVVALPRQDLSAAVNSCVYRPSSTDTPSVYRIRSPPINL